MVAAHDDDVGGGDDLSPPVDTRPAVDPGQNPGPRRNEGTQFLHRRGRRRVAEGEMIDAGGDGDLEGGVILRRQRRQRRGGVEDRGPVGPDPSTAHHDGGHMAPLHDGHPQHRFVHRHRGPGLEDVEQRRRPQGQLTLGPQRLLPHQPDGLPDPERHPGGHEPDPHLGALGVEADRKLGVDAGRPEHLVHVAQRRVREVQPEKVDALRSEAA
jgi:hypothetical protein